MSETKKILQRCEIAQADKWAIEDLYATDEAFLRHFGIESLDMLPPLPEEDAPPEESAE